MLVFEINLLGDAVEICSWVAREPGSEITELSRHTLERRVGEILGKNTLLRPEHHYQPAPDRLVFSARSFRIGTQPTQELCEGVRVKLFIGDNVPAA